MARANRSVNNLPPVRPKRIAPQGYQGSPSGPSTMWRRSWLISLSTLCAVLLLPLLAEIEASAASPPGAEAESVALRGSSPDPAIAPSSAGSADEVVATSPFPRSQASIAMDHFETPQVIPPLVTGLGWRILVILLTYVAVWYGTNWLIPAIARSPQLPVPTSAEGGPAERAKPAEGGNPVKGTATSIGADPAIGAEQADSAKREDEVNAIKRQGKIIGKCENILTVTFVMWGQPVGLALIFTAKTLARQQDIRRDAGYYLGGTMVNFTISLTVALIGRILVVGL